MTDTMIQQERRGDVLVLTLNRPERLNAAPPEMFVELREALGALDGARAVLIAANGRGFCSGADVGGGALGSHDPGNTTFKALTEAYNPTIAAIADLGVPVVSAVRGPAAGIGCSLALAADFCVASETAYFLQAFVNIGLVPDGGASWMLPRLIGRARATEMMLLGDRGGQGARLGDDPQGRRRRCARCRGVRFGRAAGGGADGRFGADAAANPPCL